MSQPAPALHPWQQYKPLYSRADSAARERYLEDWNRRMRLAACAGATFRAPDEPALDGLGLPLEAQR